MKLLDASQIKKSCLSAATTSDPNGAGFAEAILKLADCLLFSWLPNLIDPTPGEMAVAADELMFDERFGQT